LKGNYFDKKKNKTFYEILEYKFILLFINYPFFDLNRRTKINKIIFYYVCNFVFDFFFSNKLFN